MRSHIAFMLIMVIALAACETLGTNSTPVWQSTHITSTNQHARTENPRRYPHRDYVDMILGELDLRDSDTVLDVGAGDGWWTQRIVDLVGERGVVYALEVDEEKVSAMKETFADDPRVIPILGKTDSTTMAEKCCDLVFFSQVYHHLPEDGHVDYLKHLGKIIKPTGRMVVIEKYTGIDLGRGEHGTRFSDLIRHAEDGGWVLLRYELLPKTYHYIAIFAPKPLFPLEPPRNEPDSNST